jgi:hypothetical protein
MRWLGAAGCCTGAAMRNAKSIRPLVYTPLRIRPLRYTKKKLLEARALRVYNHYKFVDA